MKSYYETITGMRIPVLVSKPKEAVIERIYTYSPPLMPELILAGIEVRCPFCNELHKHGITASELATRPIERIAPCNLKDTDPQFRNNYVAINPNNIKMSE